MDDHLDRPRRGARLARLEPLAARQRRVVARRQLTALGWTDSQVEHELRTGRWHVPARGVVATQNAGLDADQMHWLGVLYAGPRAVLGHLTAARAGGLRWVGDDRVHVLTGKGDLVPPLEGFRFHQTRRPYERWVKPGEGPPRVPLEHAMLLTAERDRSTRRAIGLLAAGVQQGLTTSDQLLHTITVLRKLRHGVLFRAALGDIAGGAQSFAEIDLGRLCIRAGLVAPTRQVVRTDREGRRRYLDCTWELPDGRTVVLEIDGGFHRAVDHWWRDMGRERGIVIDGAVVLRCASVELRLSPEAVLADLLRVGVPPATGFVHAS